MLISYTYYTNLPFMNNLLYHLKIAIRNLSRDGMYSIINIGGLTIAMAASVLLLVWIYHEWSYDRFHDKEKQLYSVWSRVQFNGPLECMEKTSMPTGPALKAEYPDVVEMTRLRTKDVLCTVGENMLKVQTIYVDPGFLSMFSFPLFNGDTGSALNDLYSIILTEKAAKRLFGEENPMGKTILLDNQHHVNVTGVMKNIPSNTTFEFEALLPFEFAEKFNNYMTYWGNYTFSTYVELHPKAQVDRLNMSICNIFKEHTDGKIDSETFLFPLSKSHLYTKSENGVLTGGLIDILRIFALIALLILLIACINFTNLSTARSQKRAREVGMRKVMGSKRKGLIGRFFGEAIILAFIAGAIAIMIVVLSMPLFKELMGKPLSFDWANGYFIFFMLGFVLLAGLLAGSYPAFRLSSYIPIKVLKGNMKGERTLVTPRKLLIIVQFTFSVFLMIATFVIHRQILYAQNKDSGYNKEQLIYVNISNDIDKNYELIKHELINSGTAVSMTKTFAPMTQLWANASGVKWKGSAPDNKIIIDLFFGDSDWAKTVGATIIEGREINTEEFPTDVTAALLNETAVKTMGFDDPIGEQIDYWGNKVHVVGVIKDFILQSPYDPIEPMLIVAGGPVGFNTVHIRLNGAKNMADNLSAAEQIFKKFNPKYPFDYKLIDEEYASKYASEQRVGDLSLWFTALAVFISCMGLFALVAYMAETRRKEIAIRKVLGASVKDVVALLSKEFLLLVLVSVTIATPIAWWVMDKWLSSYVYHTNIPWWLFTSVGFSCLCIALLTVCFQAIKAATSNPVKSLRTE